MTLLEAHLKAATHTQKPRSYPLGARYAKDRHHYVADPKRRGKFLKVVHHV
jgi:hypothetical protein